MPAEASLPGKEDGGSKVRQGTLRRLTASSIQGRLTAWLLAVLLSTAAVVWLSVSSTFLRPEAHPEWPGTTMLSLWKENVTAICLVGGARNFEATGPSILEFVLRSFEPRVDIFVHAPLDENSAKLWVLGSSVNVAAVRVFPNVEIEQPRVDPGQVLDPNGSPNGGQGILQYFRLVEGCSRMIEEQEGVSGAQYAWVVRLRPDSLWSAPFPPISALSPGSIGVPYGSDYGGVNDRLGVSSGALRAATLERLSLLGSLQGAYGPLTLNSEKVFKVQLERNGVQLQRLNFSFCVLSHRFGLRQPCHRSSPFCFSVASAGPLNGAYCLPCVPCVAGADWCNPPPGQRLCNMSADPWVSGEWEQRFDAAVGQRLAMQRAAVSGVGFEGCVEKMAAFRQQVVKWDAPPPEVLCLRAHLGRATPLGARAADFPTFLRPLSPSSVVVAPVFGGLPNEATTWVAALSAAVPGVAVERPNVTASEVSAILRNGTSAGWGHPLIDILQFGEGEGFGVLESLFWKLHWNATQVASAGKETQASDSPSVQGQPVPVCQMLLAVPHDRASELVGLNSTQHTQSEVMEALNAAVDTTLGLRLAECRQGGPGLPNRCLFFSPSRCQH